MTRRDYIATILRENGESFADVVHVEPAEFDIDIDCRFVFDAIIWASTNIYRFYAVKIFNSNHYEMTSQVIIRNPPGMEKLWNGQ